MNTFDYFLVGLIVLLILLFTAYIAYGIGRDFKSAYQQYLADELEQAQKEVYYLKVELRETEHSREAIKNSHAHLAKLHNEQIDKILKLKNEIKELESACERRNDAIKNYEERIHGYKIYIIYLQKKYSNENLKFEDSNKEKMESLRKIIEPIEEWINDNASPHDKLIITQGNAEFTSGEFGIPLKIKD